MNCPKDLNSFLLSEPLFENTFLDNECEQAKFYGDCFHCFATSISRRDKQLINAVLDEIRIEIDAESAKAFKYPNWERAKALEWALSVIDKYRAESEKTT